jgi:hypothetical protein
MLFGWEENRWKMGGLISVCFPRNQMQILFSGLEIKKQKTKCIKNDENLA